ncbi:hypothetical protein CHLRE_12g519550v5 [Chlamydomonas reinhardtii]|uniref:Uncharacterized protein n=1 Tax=Chlamydomonas reinhardtii TaxID=3055 RepID=A0A2K3D3Z6_CHLRE|nr:uncharacterized protein CHLRE_12g519550v5 [Chlamydomonas reinhardtii]PNW75262.1 hypothetical protein CHLRE_12g519550v5 [Chlamydomonas reinhardtii]
MSAARLISRQGWQMGPCAAERPRWEAQPSAPLAAVSQARSRAAALLVARAEAASSAGTAPVRQPPLPAQGAAQASAGAAASLATASELLGAIQRCASVAELRGALQRGQAAGCLTNAHCIAMLARLVALTQAQTQTPAADSGSATAGASPAAAPQRRVPKEARQLGQELWRRLQPHRAALSPALQAALDQAQAALQLGEQSQRPQARPKNMAQGAGQVTGPLQAQAPRQQQQRQAQGQGQGQSQVQELGQGHVIKHKTQAQTAQPAGKTHPGRRAANGAGSRSSPPQAAAAPAAAAAHPSGGAQVRSEQAQYEQQQELKTQAGPGPAAPPSTQTADVPGATAAVAAGAAATMASASPLQDDASPLTTALQLGWQVLQQRQQEGPRPASSSGDGGVAVSSVDLNALEETLQTQPAASMALSDIAEVLQLLGALRLMPRHEWLCGARDTLRAAVMEAEAQVAEARTEGGQPGAGVRAVAEGAEVMLRQADLSALLEAVEELMALCWEADAGSRHTPPQPASGTGSGQEQGQGQGHGQGQEQGVGPPVPQESVAAVGAEGPQGGALACEQAVHGPAGAAVASEASPPASPEPETAASTSATAKAGASSEPAGGILGAAAHESAAAQPQHQEEPLWEEPAPEEPVAALRRLQALMQAARRAAGGAAGPVLTGCLADDGDDAAAALNDLQQLLEREAAAALLLPAQPQPQLQVREQEVAATAHKAVRAPALTPLRLACMLDAARALQPQLSAALLAPAARLMVSLVRGSAEDEPGAAGTGPAQEHVAALLSACVAARYVPPVHLLDKLAALAFAAQQPSPQQRRTGAYVRALHECGAGLSRLGHRLNAQRFSAWADAAAAAPRQLSVRQLLQLMSACLERRALLRTDAAAAGAAAGGGTGALAAVVEVPSRLAQLSAAEAATTVAAFAEQQGVRLSADGAAALLCHLTPRLTQLQPGQLAVLLPALSAAGALGAAAPDAAAADAFLAAHSSALLPSAELLQPAEELLPLLRAYAGLQYRPPPLLLLGLALGLEGALASSPLPAVLASLHLLLCRLRMLPNEGLATAVRDDLLPRLMVAATAAPSPVAPQQGAAAGAASATSAAPSSGTASSASATASPAGLTTAQKLKALDVLVAARVRPHPAQLAALLDVGMTLTATGSSSGSRLAGLSGRQLTRLLWLCVAFRALPSWRFVGEWLQAAAVVLRQAADATPAPPSHTTTSATTSDGGAAGDRSGSGSESTGGVSPCCLVRMGWCLSQMGLRPEPAWQAEYHAALLPVLPALDLEALSLAATSVLALRSRPGAEWLEGWMRAALGRMEAPGVAAAELDGASAARLVHFAAAAEAPVTRDWMQSFFLHTLHLVEASPAPLAPASSTTTAPGTSAGAAGAAAGRRSAFTADQLALTLRGLAALGYRPPQPWLEAALEALRRAAAAAVATADSVSGNSSGGSSSSLSPACYPVALAALGRLAPDVAAELGPGTVVETLVRAAHEQRERFSELELTWLLETLEQSYSGYRLPPAAAANLAAVLRRRQAGDAGESGGASGDRGEGEGEGRGESDVAGSLADAVSTAWLAW